MRALEAYWGGFASWWIVRLDRWWRRTEIVDRLRASALDVGQALISARHGPDDGVRRELDRFGWLVEVAARSGALSDEERGRARAAIGVVRGLWRPGAGAKGAAP